MLSPEIEFVAMLGGNSVYMSWGDLVTTVIPAMKERIDACERAIGRFDTVIHAEEKDLKEFSDAINFVEFLFPENGLVMPNQTLDSRALPGASNMAIQDAEIRMKEMAKTTADLAKQQRQEAQEIRAANAKIDRLSALLGVASAVNSAASSAQQSDAQTPANVQVQATTKNYVVYQQNSWIISPTAQTTQQPAISNPPKN